MGPCEGGCAVSQSFQGSFHHGGLLAPALVLPVLGPCMQLESGFRLQGLRLKGFAGALWSIFSNYGECGLHLSVLGMSLTSIFAEEGRK